MRSLRISLSFAIGVLVIATPALTAPSPTQLTPRVSLIEGTLQPGRQPDGNSVVLVAPKGLIVIDTGRHDTHTAQLIDFAVADQRPIVAVINTHWHLDHTGGNVMLRERYPQAHVYASNAIHDALQGFLRDYERQLSGAIAQANTEDDNVRAWQAEIKLIDAGQALTPDVVIDSSKSLTIAGRKLSFHLEHNAVTAADLWVIDPTEKILISGDLVTLPVPFFDTACPRQWERALQHVEMTSFKTLIPGHGRPLTASEFKSYRRAFSELLTCAESKQPDSVCVDRWTHGVDGLIDAQQRSQIPAMLDYYLKAVLRAPEKTRDRYCPA